MRYRAKIAIILAVSLLVSIAFAREMVGAKWLELLDNIQWTSISGIAAYLGWVGYQDANKKERKYRYWFFLGLFAYFLGEIVWNTLTFFSRITFPNLSDVFYILLGPCCIVGLLIALKMEVNRRRKVAVLLDITTITVSLVGLVLSIYLSHKIPSHWLKVATLSIYPIALLSAASLALLINPFLKLKPNWAVFLFFIGLLAEGVIWMKWNLTAINGKPAPGSGLNSLFSVAQLLLGIGAMGWHTPKTQEADLIKFYRRIQLVIPIIAMMLGVVIISIILLKTVSPSGQFAAVISALVIITLAMARQSLLLADSERLLEADRKIAEINTQYEYLANHDPLTSLPNRRLFEDRLTHAISMAKRNDYELALLFVDIDHFKVVNDSMGHTEGDALLVKIVDRISSRLREQDTFARWGGDEFVILLENIDSKTQAMVIANYIRQLLSAPFELSNSTRLTVTASIGISTFPHDAENYMQLIRNADSAMYYAKLEGRNNYRFYSKNLTLDAQEKLTLEGQIRAAAEQGQFEIHYQPIMQFDKKYDQFRLVSVEALIRWRKSPTELIMPNDFIPLAEEKKIIIPIGKWVLINACQQLVDWDAKGLDKIGLSINISPVQFYDANLEEDICTVLKVLGIAMDRVTLEVTEGAIIKDEESAAKILNALRARGLKVSIDDFGMGHSSLGKLKQLPVTELKVDRMFVQNIPVSEDDMQIASTIVTMAKGLKLDVVAEGVETKDQLDFFEKQGCNRYQGYFFSKPLPAYELEKLLQHRL